jgi:ABC-type nitrate/sulfonate/bicarbonate transport system substrate-binding protein
MSKATPQTLWYTRCPAPTPLSIAAQLGWVDAAFAPLGITISSIRDSKDPGVRQSHFDHRLDWSYRQGGNIPPIWARSNGRQTRLVGLTTTDEFQAIITLPESGITTVKDLAGRRLGVPRRPAETIDFQRATSLKGIVSALSLDGLATSAVDLVYLDNHDAALQEPNHASFLGLKRRLPYGDEIRALHRGEIDAFFVKGAEGVVTANLIGAHVVAEFGFHADPKIRVNNGTPRPLTVDATFADERPDLVAQLILAVDRASQWAAEHPAETVRFIAREIGVSEDAVWSANGPEVHRHLTLTLEDDQIAAIAHFKDFLRDWGFIENDFDVSSWIDHRPLELSRQRQAAE